MIKTFIITQNEPFFIPKMIDYILKKNDSSYNVIGFTVLNPHRKNKNYFNWFKERSIIYNYFELFIACILFLYAKVINLLFSVKSSYNVKSVFKNYNIAEFPTDDINSEEYVNLLIKNNIDVIISISCPQIFSEDILNSAKYCINAHGTLLPRHRGVFGSWWTLYYGNKVGGSTIHTMELKLDAGEILWQKEFQVVANDTQYSIAYKTKRNMAFGIVKTLNDISIDNIKKLTEKYEPSYHRAPTKVQGKEFHKKGLKVITLKDINLILSKEFS